ncbi:peptidase family M20/M25/M40 protein [Phlyctema vagabunda]|uniref:Peptidase family M20/M25/M40 protein n=1 Tax=Phlyctema vagabunda TaxID=108571 RepID=A0ABR4P4P3_9HELO
MHRRGSESGHGTAEDAFAALQASFNAARRSRPPHLNDSGQFEGDGRVPLGDLHRRSSRFGLQGMFTRSKSTKITPDIVSPVLAEPPQPNEHMLERTISKFTNPRPAPLPVAPGPPALPSKPASKPSRLNLKTGSIKEHKAPKTVSPKARGSAKTPTRTTTVWDPPPLFQAYPQAVKHATLSASTMSADAILRISQHKRNSSIVAEMANAPLSKETNKSKHKHKRQMSAAFTKAVWTQKIFVLVTSGYLLQYSGEGSFDRLPEKMMQLGKDSVAFASDVIPGKHWVLQISQAMDSDGAPSSDHRSLFSRLTFRGADYRRSATSLLLVLNSAEELDSWIAVVRREIEALGGKKNVTETGKPKSDEMVPTLKNQPSHRYLVQREPDQFSAASSPQESSYSVPPWTNENLHPENLVDAVSAINEIQSPSSIRPSTGHHSMTTLCSHDGQQLESLRDSATRYSYMSSGQRTYPTSPSSSPTSSPTRDSFFILDDQPRNLSVQEDLRPKPNTLAINERRRSTQVVQNSIPESSGAAKFRPHSTCDVPTRAMRNDAASTPYFSNSPGQRFSYTKSPVSSHGFSTHVKERPLTATTSRSHDPTLKGSRKAPPPALTMASQLSPVRDIVHPRKLPRSPKSATPTSVTPQHTLRSKRSTTIPQSPRFLPSMPSTEHSSGCLSTYKPKGSPEGLSLSFQSPRRTQSTTRKNSLPASPFILGHAERSQSEGSSAAIARDTRAGTPPRLSASPTSPVNHRLRQSSSAVLSHALSSPFEAPRTSPRRPASRSAKADITKSILSTHHNLRLQTSSKDLVMKGSSPLLLNSPPPAPPPDCALPPLPPPTGSFPRPATASVRA